MTKEEIIQLLRKLPTDKGLYILPDSERNSVSDLYRDLNRKGLVYLKDTEDSGVIAAGLTSSGLQFLKS